MSQRREIPGFYFDEEKNKYFAIPKIVAGFNSSEIRILDDKIKSKKRRKLANKQKQLSPLAQYLISYKTEQNEFYFGLEQMIDHSKSKGYPLHEDMQKTINERFNELSPTRLFQSCGIINRVSFPPETCGELSGFKITFKPSSLDTMYQYVFFKKTPEGDIPTYSLLNQYNYSADEPIRRIEYASPSIMSFVHFLDERPFNHFIPTRNGYMIKSEHEPNKTTNLLYIMPNLYIRKIKNNNFIDIGEKLSKRESDITSVDYLNSISACGYRNGTIEIFHNQKSFTIDFGGPICGIALLVYENTYYCVVSGLSNKLHSYKLEVSLGSASLYMIYDEYKWKDRLSLNLKQDRHCDGIFGVESEIDDDPSNLEIKFYSILCPKPLKMLSGPFLIKNNSSSQILWALNQAMLLVYNSDIQIMDFYKSYRTTM